MERPIPLPLATPAIEEHTRGSRRRPAGAHCTARHWQCARESSASQRASRLRGTTLERFCFGSATEANMRAAVQFTSAAEYGDVAAVARLYTESFAEYYSDGKLIPVTVSAQQLEEYLREEQMSLSDCPVALLGGKAAGFATVGVRPQEGTAWCKGFGIVPEFRGAHLSLSLSLSLSLPVPASVSHVPARSPSLCLSGAHIGRALAEEMKRRARIAGATRHMTLGCMKDNSPAIKTYEACGFVVAHESYSMEWTKPAGWTPAGALSLSRALSLSLSLSLSRSLSLSLSRSLSLARAL